MLREVARARPRARAAALHVREWTRTVAAVAHGPLNRAVAVVARGSPRVRLLADAPEEARVAIVIAGPVPPFLALLGLALLAPEAVLTVAIQVVVPLRTTAAQAAGARASVRRAQILDWWRAIADSTKKRRHGYSGVAGRADSALRT